MKIKLKPGELEVLKSLGDSNNWKWLEEVVNSRRDKITKEMHGIKFKQFDDKRKEFILAQVIEYIRHFTQIYIHNKSGGAQTMYRKYLPILKKYPEELREMLALLGSGSEQDIDRILNIWIALGMNERGQPKAIWKGWLVVTLSEIFYDSGFRRYQSYEKVAVLFKILQEPATVSQIPQPLREHVCDFLSTLSSNLETIKGLFKRYKKHRQPQRRRKRHEPHPLHRNYKCAVCQNSLLFLRYTLALQNHSILSALIHLGRT